MAKLEKYTCDVCGAERKEANPLVRGKRGIRSEPLTRLSLTFYVCGNGISAACSQEARSRFTSADKSALTSCSTSFSLENSSELLRLHGNGRASQARTSSDTPNRTWIVGSSTSIARKRWAGWK
jgi:hypothetical protein